MYPRAFAYRRPASVEETLALLADHGDEARLLAGGQSLIPLLKLRLTTPLLVVDINRVPDGGRLAIEGDRLVLGPLVRHADVVASPLVRSELGWVAEAARQIGDRQVRSLGTAAGALAEADPAGDWPAIALALGGEVTVESRAARRTIPVPDLFVDAYTTALQPQEMITGVRLRRPRGRAGGAYVKIERRVGDFAVAGCAACLELDGDGACSYAGIALTGVGLMPLKTAAAEARLLGGRPDLALLDAVSEEIAQTIEPLADARGSAEYKRRVAGAAAARALRVALAAAGGGDDGWTGR